MQLQRVANSWCQGLHADPNVVDCNVKIESDIARIMYMSHCRGTVIAAVACAAVLVTADVCLPRVTRSLWIVVMSSVHAFKRITIKMKQTVEVNVADAGAHAEPRAEQRHPFLTNVVA